MKVSATLLALALVAGACGSDDKKQAADKPVDAGPKLTIASPSEGATVDGNVVELNLGSTGVDIKKADNDTSGKSGHFHVFIDKDPVAVGASIPKEAGVVHSADNPVRLTGLSVGSHKLTVVLGDGAHTRITDLADTVTVNVKGPSIDASAPATGVAGQPVTATIKIEGVKLVAAADDIPPTKQSGHLHAFIDTDPSLVAPGQSIPKEPGKIEHFASETFTTGPLAAGEHTIWFVLGDGGHVAYDPPVIDKITITVA